MNQAQNEAIANADANTSNAALPTYSELVEALRRLTVCYDRYSGTGRRHEPPAVNANALLARIPTAAPEPRKLREFMASVVPAAGGVQAVVVEAFNPSDAHDRLVALGYSDIRNIT